MKTIVTGILTVLSLAATGSANATKDTKLTCLQVNGGNGEGIAYQQVAGLIMSAADGGFFIVDSRMNVIADKLQRTESAIQNSTNQTVRYSSGNHVILEFTGAFDKAYQRQNLYGSSNFPNYLGGERFDACYDLN